MACSNREDRGGGAGGGSHREGQRMAEVSALWPLGTPNANPLAIQAPKWFDLGRRVHEKAQGALLTGSAPGAAGSLFLSLEVCTIIITNNINDYSDGRTQSVL